MFEMRFIELLKQKNCEKSSEDISEIISKIENQRKLSSIEFQRVFELLYVSGPTIKYQNTGTSIREIHQANNVQKNLQNF
jgi:hypothetical protein